MTRSPGNGGSPEIYCKATELDKAALSQRHAKFPSSKSASATDSSPDESGTKSVDNLQDDGSGLFE